MSVWNDLLTHRDVLTNISLQEIYNQENDRVQKYHLQLEDLYIDYSRNRVDQKTVKLLLQLADEKQLGEKIKRLFGGETVNLSEQRPAMHFALRSTDDFFNHINFDSGISAQIKLEIERLNDFFTRQESGLLTGYNGKKIKNFVNIGIGGSELGPKLLHDALKPYWQSDINTYFLANIDADEVYPLLKSLDAEETLFVISSKSFTTTETRHIANHVKQWLQDSGCTDISRHLVAITANVKRAQDFGVDEKNIFRIWDWVGGRYSVWSAISLVTIAKIGMKNFRDFLAGANVMDQHFIDTPLEKNIPVILGLLDIWSINFLGNNTQAIIPYSSSLALLPNYLSQLFMESNGKNLDQSQNSLTCDSGVVIWGGIGTNVQHAFMQLLHQGTHSLPVEFLVSINNHYQDTDYQKRLFANCLAQSEALMSGNSATTNPGDYKHVPGNRPSTIIVYDQLTPATLGKLLAIYEHRVFVQASIWDINPFDQWGVELGKQLSEKLLGSAENIQPDEIDPTTRHLLEYFSRKQK